MKKLLYIFAIATFSTVGFTSCSEDDPIMEIPNPNPNPNVSNSLEVTCNFTYNKTTGIYYGYTNTPITFTAKSNGATISDATFLVDGVEIQGGTYSKKTIGNIKVYAKRAGYLDSNVINVRFDQDPNEK